MVFQFEFEPPYWYYRMIDASTHSVPRKEWRETKKIAFLTIDRKNRSEMLTYSVVHCYTSTYFFLLRDAISALTVSTTIFVFFVESAPITAGCK